MTRREWRRILETVATKRPLLSGCARYSEWESARALLPRCSPATQAQARRLVPTMQSGSCADCRVPIIWGAATPRASIKVCEACVDMRIAAGPHPATRVENPIFDDEDRGR
jgi:hypothetical protein